MPPPPSSRRSSGCWPSRRCAPAILAVLPTPLPAARRSPTRWRDRRGVQMTKVARFVAFAALAFALGVGVAIAQDYPSRPITILVPQAPGASSDLLARTLGERLQAQWGQPIVIDNRPGAGGNVGTAV